MSLIIRLRKLREEERLRTAQLQEALFVRERAQRTVDKYQALLDRTKREHFAVKQELAKREL